MSTHTCPDSDANTSIDPFRLFATDDERQFFGQILVSPEGLTEEGSRRPADEAFNALFEQHLSEFLAGCRTTRLVLGKSPKEWLVFKLFGQFIVRLRLDEGRYVIEASAAVDIDRQAA
jgi:hypothetical protein